jgi:hypothetical protein
MGGMKDWRFFGGFFFLEEPALNGFLTVIEPGPGWIDMSVRWRKPPKRFESWDLEFERRDTIGIQSDKPVKKAWQSVHELKQLYRACPKGGAKELGESSLKLIHIVDRHGVHVPELQHADLPQKYVTPNSTADWLFASSTRRITRESDLRWVVLTSRLVCVVTVAWGEEKDDHAIGWRRRGRKESEINRQDLEGGLQGSLIAELLFSLVQELMVVGVEGRAKEFDRLLRCQRVESMHKKESTPHPDKSEVNIYNSKSVLKRRKRQNPKSRSAPAVRHDNPTSSIASPTPR